jgi:hypothetical protein
MIKIVRTVRIARVWVHSPTALKFAFIVRKRQVAKNILRALSKDEPTSEAIDSFMEWSAKAWA